jgi:hypothetical protein
MLTRLPSGSRSSSRLLLAAEVRTSPTFPLFIPFTHFMIIISTDLLKEAANSPSSRTQFTKGNEKYSLKLPVYSYLKKKFLFVNWLKN